MNKLRSLESKYKKVSYPCEICGSRNFHILQNYGRTSEPGVYGNLKIMCCKKCGYKMQNPRFQKSFYKEYYNHLYRKIAFGDVMPSNIYLNQQKKRGKKVLDWARENNVQTGSMLDHGCASGATMIAWKKLGWETYGIDPHRPSINLAKQIGLNANIATGEKLPFMKDKFDLVLSLGSLEHAYDLNKTFAELSRVIKINGYLLIRWRSDKIFGSPLEYYNHNHYRFFTPKTIKILLYKYGFKIKKRTNRKIEGWDSYSYILCQNKKYIKNYKDLSEIIKKELAKQPMLEMKKIKITRTSYYKKCKKFLNFVKKNNMSYSKLYENIKKNNVKWGFLGGSAKFKIQRSIFEAENYIKNYDQNMIN